MQQDTTKEGSIAMAMASLASIVIKGVPSYLIIGGLPRSGTSSCERWFHSHERCFISDEYPGYLEPTFQAAVGAIANLTQAEASIWTDSIGRTWRDLNVEEQSRGRKIALNAAAVLATRPRKFLAKDLGGLNVFGIKMPSSENALQFIAKHLAFGPITFLYCVRDPIKILKSQWEMPWVRNDDQDGFVDGLIRSIDQSLTAFANLASGDYQVAVWQTPNNNLEASRIVERLGLIDLLGTAPSMSHIDEWPRERRRPVPPLREAVIQRFAESAAVEQYRKKFLRQLSQGDYTNGL